MRGGMRLAKASDGWVSLDPAMANRHGLVAGATGTGKTVTLQGLAESFSRMGVPVFLADVKGDLSGLGKAGGASAKVKERVRLLEVEDHSPEAFPVVFWDVFGRQGHPLRTTVSEMGPLMLARVLQLNDTQAAVLSVAFRVADEHGLLLLDLKDLQAVLRYLGENAAAFTSKFGNISPASVGAIQRGLLQLEAQGAGIFFGEPALNLDDLLQTDGGRGVINILAADQLMQSPKLYASMLLWLLGELFEQLPEVGDLERPKLVFFFDEAHLLFNDMPGALLEKVEQVVRLIRSKGVGVYFVTQNPRDIPDRVLGQLGNRIQHALRAFTPADQKAVRAAAQTFRANPALDTEAILTQLGIGEALVSVLDAQGQPTVVKRALVAPPASHVGPLTAGEREALIRSSIVAGVYETAIDRESAYERLTGAVAGGSGQQSAPPVAEESRGFFGRLFGGGDAAPTPAAPSSPVLPRVEPRTRAARPTRSVGDVVIKTAARSLTSNIAGAIGREIVRGVLGGLLGGSSRRRR
jgi:uncharacterized protein